MRLSTRLKTSNFAHPKHGKLLRQLVQLFFFTLTLYIGYEFWLFVHYFEADLAGPSPERPGGVEGFLPIGALTGVRYWLATGTLHPFHPASVIIFIAVVVTSIILRKSFCGWICPVGFVSEFLYKPWQKFFKKNVALPWWLDAPLRSLKYVLLLFFIWGIFFAMGTYALAAFMDSDYWKVADVRMLRFFTHISPLAFGVILGLLLLSIPIKNFWCRFLCPYGALIGVTSFLSPFSITRNNVDCTHCMKCTRNCPAYLPVEASTRITSPECTSCLTCLSGCAAGALTYSSKKNKVSLRPWHMVVILAVTFFGIIQIAKWNDLWQSNLSDAQMRQLVPQVYEMEHPQ